MTDLREAALDVGHAHAARHRLVAGGELTTRGLLTLTVLLDALDADARARLAEALEDAWAAVPARDLLVASRHRRAQYCP
jgi:hypothetical protein